MIRLLNNSLIAKIILFLLISPLVLGLAAPTASAQIGVGFRDIINNNNIAVGTNTPRGVIVNVIQAVLVLLAVIAFMALVIGAFLYITSIGNEERTRRAKMTIIYAIVGLLVVGISAMLVNAIINIL